MSDEQILAEFDGAIDCGESSGGYLWAITFLSFAVILLPVLYCALVGAVAFLGFRGVSNAIIEQRLLLGAFIAVLGAFVLLFLIKPLFSWKRRVSADLLILDPTAEPLLFQFVDKLSIALGAPTPSRIEVDCEANASASLRHGFLSLFTDDVVLRIGLPLAAGLTVRQFAGVLAHELGHFRQRAGMRGSFAIRIVNHWFRRVVFERDYFDEYLVTIRRREGKNPVLYYVLVWMVESARGLMWLLMIVGELLSNGVMRRMEFDADRYEAHIAGAGDFETTSRALRLLHVASIMARSDLQSAWTTQRLADDLPRLIVAKARELPAEVRATVFKSADERKTRWFDTHPCDTARFEHVRSLDTMPAVRCDLPARRLFADFSQVSCWATDAFYRSILEEKFDSASLIPTKRLVAERAGEREASTALQRFFQGQMISSRPILPGNDALQPVDNPAEEQQMLMDARERMLAAVATLDGAPTEYEQRAVKIAVARARIALAGALPAGPKVSRLRRTAEADATSLLAEQHVAVRVMGQYEDSAHARLTAALRLVQVPEIARKIIAGGSVHPLQRAHKISIVLDALRQRHVEVSAVRSLVLTMRVLLSVLDPKQPHRGIADRLMATTRDVNTRLRGIRRELEGFEFPFSHAVRGISIGASLTDALPPGDSVVPTLIAGETLVDRYFVLLHRVLATATELAERVETAIGLPALSNPKPAEADDADQAESKLARKRSRKYWIGYSARALSGAACLGLLISFTAGPATPCPVHTISPPTGSPRPGASHRPRRPRRVPSLRFIHTSQQSRCRRRLT